jgi:dolichyl-phosphate beta-glucosyltransferase
MLLHMSSIALIIPCFNEAARLSIPDFTAFLNANPSWTLVFVNDGSTDHTASLLDSIKNNFPLRTILLHFEQNKGKAAAIYEGMKRCSTPESGQFDYIGYLDADLSTSLNEMLRIAAIARDQDLDYACGSRIKKLNADIHRSLFRHLTGRVIATIIDYRFTLGIYDTQCGSKLFRPQLVNIITERNFHTRWLFDIEIFLRINRKAPGSRGEEIPLLAWTCRKGSKLSIFHSISILKEINSLFKHYPK